jgi:hypothetical protein
MKIGTHIKLPDGRVGTVVYNGLDGVGIKWGKHELTLEDRELIGQGGPFGKARADYPWFPDAMLREKSVQDLFAQECIGEEYEVLDQ